MLTFIFIPWLHKKTELWDVNLEFQEEFLELQEKSRN